MGSDGGYRSNLEHNQTDLCIWKYTRLEGMALIVEFDLFEILHGSMAAVGLARYVIDHLRHLVAQALNCACALWNCLNSLGPRPRMFAFDQSHGRNVHQRDSNRLAFLTQPRRPRSCARRS